MWPRCRQRTRTAQRLRQNLAALRGRYQALAAGVLLAEPKSVCAQQAAPLMEHGSEVAESVLS